MLIGYTYIVKLLLQRRWRNSKIRFKRSEGRRSDDSLKGGGRELYCQSYTVNSTSPEIVYLSGYKTEIRFTGVRC